MPMVGTLQENNNFSYNNVLTVSKSNCKFKKGDIADILFVTQQQCVSSQIIFENKTKNPW